MWYCIVLLRNNCILNSVCLNLRKNIIALTECQHDRPLLQLNDSLSNSIDYYRLFDLQTVDCIQSAERINTASLIRYTSVSVDLGQHTVLRRWPLYTVHFMAAKN